MANSDITLNQYWSEPSGSPIEVLHSAPDGLAEGRLSWGPYHPRSCFVSLAVALLLHKLLYNLPEACI